MPVVDPTVATDVLLLVHTPNSVALVNVVDEPEHTDEAPPMAAGVAATLTIPVAMQPVGNIYVIADVPAATPVTIPDEDPIVAVEVELLDHGPPEEVLLSVVVDPIHTLSVPEMVFGKGFMVTVTLPCTPQQPSVDTALK